MNPIKFNSFIYFQINIIILIYKYFLQTNAEIIVLMIYALISLEFFLIWTPKLDTEVLTGFCG